MGYTEAELLVLPYRRQLYPADALEEEQFSERWCIDGPQRKKEGYRLCFNPSRGVDWLSTRKYPSTFRGEIGWNLAQSISVWLNILLCDPTAIGSLISVHLYGNYIKWDDVDDQTREIK